MDYLSYYSNEFGGSHLNTDGVYLVDKPKLPKRSMELVQETNEKRLQHLEDAMRYGVPTPHQTRMDLLERFDGSGNSDSIDSNSEKIKYVLITLAILFFIVIKMLCGIDAKLDFLVFQFDGIQGGGGRRRHFGND